MFLGGEERTAEKGILSKSEEGRRKKNQKEVVSWVEEPSAR